MVTAGTRRDAIQEQGNAHWAVRPAGQATLAKTVSYLPLLMLRPTHLVNAMID